MFGFGDSNGKSHRASKDAWAYRIHDGAAQFRFQLEGPLASQDVTELDQCWRTASSTLGGRAFVVDVTSLTSVDEGGRELLTRWRDVGARFVGDAKSAAVVGDFIPAAEPPATRTKRPLLYAAAPWVVALITLLLTMTLRAAEPVGVIVTPSAAPDEALARYFSGLDKNRPWGEETVEIDASLPKLKEQGRLQAIRRLLLGKPQYQVFEQEGSHTVRQQVIARYLSAEVQSASLSPSLVAVSQANYQFKYEGSVDTGSGLEYVFQITPRKKRTGLVRGMLWIDAQTGSGVRLSGYLVKRPSIFIKRVDVTRETNLVDGVAESRVTHLALDTRLVGRAELTIHERPCSSCAAAAAAGTPTNGAN